MSVWSFQVIIGVSCIWFVTVALSVRRHSCDGFEHRCRRAMQQHLIPWAADACPFRDCSYPNAGLVLAKSVGGKSPKAQTLKPKQEIPEPEALNSKPDAPNPKP